MDKFIMDTSVWIDFFHDRLAYSDLDFVESGLREQRVVVTDIIVHELLVGTKSQRTYDDMMAKMALFDIVRIGDEQLGAFNHFAWSAHRKGLAGKYTDLAIAYLANHHGMPLMSLDGYFRKLADHHLIKIVNVTQ